MESNEILSNREEQPTAEEVQSHISAAFDSVSLINGILAGTSMVDSNIDDKKSTVERNAGHLKLMMAKEWFDAGLTETQRTDIGTCITSSDTYLTSN